MPSILRSVRQGLLVAGVAAGLLALSACSTDSPADAGPTADGTPVAGAESSLPTVTEGKLTIATGEPAYEPWVKNDDPASCEGFEAAVACAVAEQLGFSADDITWVRTTFDAAITPGEKDWDLNIQQYSISEDRAKVVDFSSPYYTTSQVVVAKDEATAKTLGSIDALKKASVGVMVGTTSYTTLVDATGVEPQVFNTNADLVAALQSGQIDAVVTDLPTAFYVTGAQVEGSAIVGQFADTTGGDELAFVLPKDSKLTADVTAAVDALRDSGKLEEITTKWLSTEAAVPVLK